MPTDKYIVTLDIMNLVTEKGLAANQGYSIQNCGNRNVYISQSAAEPVDKELSHFLKPGVSGIFTPTSTEGIWVWVEADDARITFTEAN